MAELELVLLEALKVVIAQLKKPVLAEINENTNVFENIDSFSVVDLMLETEMQLEAAFGTYVTLADETMFDAEKSPLLKWSKWLSYVEERCAEG